MHVCFKLAVLYVAFGVSVWPSQGRGGLVLALPTAWRGTAMI